VCLGVTAPTTPAELSVEIAAPGVSTRMRSAASPLPPSGMKVICSDETAELGRHAE